MIKKKMDLFTLGLSMGFDALQGVLAPAADGGPLQNLADTGIMDPAALAFFARSRFYPNGKAISFFGRMGRIHRQASEGYGRNDKNGAQVIAKGLQEVEGHG
jgi:hypothetical protein